MRGKQLLKSSSTLLGMIVLGGTVLSACGSAKQTADNNNGADALQLKVMMIQQGPEPPKPDNPSFLKLEHYTNTKLDITWVPATTYDDKVNATIAAGNLPDLMLMRNTRASAQMNAQQSGMFWDLKPYLKDYKNLSKLTSVAIQNNNVDGHLYGIPRERVLARYGLIIRKDWLDNLGLSMPKTVDDIYNVAKAFTLNDPNKDGKNDTFGIQDDKSMELLKQIALYLGAPNGWGIQNGKVAPSFMYPQFKDALALLRKMNSEKLVNNDFPIAPKYDYFNQEKAGMYFSVIDDGDSRHTDLLKADPKAQIDVQENFDGPLGQRVRANSGYDSLIVIPKTTVTSETKLKQILGFLDKLGDPQMDDLFNMGVQGSDYTMDNGKVTKIANAPGVLDIVNFKWDDQTAGNQGDITPLRVKIIQLFKDNEKLAVVDSSAPVTSTTYNTKGKQLDQNITDAEVKYILGQIDDKGWDDAVAKWQKDGGDQVIQEYTADYNKNQAQK
ncbi:MAG: hypothetical protein JWN30_2779 [Bacilli bacterium]|nr:hypothetical protein [Bacilli bacterium]